MSSDSATARTRLCSASGLRRRLCGLAASQSCRSIRSRFRRPICDAGTRPPRRWLTVRTKPSAIFGQILLEGLLLAAGGLILGLLLGHGVVALAAASFAQLREMGLTALRFEPAEFAVGAAALALGAVSALIPALRVFRVDIANTLAHAR